jgi:hypothetical protein
MRRKLEWGENAEFSGLGLHRMRLGLQPFMAARWQIHWRDEDELRTAARPGVRISCLRRTLESRRGSPLAKSIADQVLWDSHPVRHSERDSLREFRMG